jgi:hypothetical protein
METESIETRFHTLLDNSISNGDISPYEYIELLGTYEKLGPECAMEDLIHLLKVEEYRRSSEERAITISLIGIIAAVVLMMLVYINRE